MTENKELDVISDYQRDESYRDSIATVDNKGDRIWIYPKKPKGRYHRARAAAAILLLAILFAGPFIRIGGHPLLLLNFLERKFVIFGVPFWPQDFHLFALGFLTFVIFVVLFTAVFGRVWCGWACPQTVFMEMVFRKIEYWIEGDARQQRKLNAMPMNAGKFFKKAAKQGIFFSIAFLIGNTFMAYIVGSERWWEIVTQPPTANFTGFTAVIIFSGIFYFVFSYFREQACVIVCPYGRFQSVLLDKASIVVSYDFKRGEPRGKLSRKATQPLENKGDCIDCNQCVDVCPTGIDIRNGTQLECVNCTACMDACDDVMTKINKPKGLIRYASYNSIKEGVSRLINPRVLGYSAVLTLVLSLFLTLFLMRSPIETTILRVPGTLFQPLENGDFSNVYQFRIVNKTFNDMKLNVQIKGVEARIRLNQQDVVVPQDDFATSTMVVEIPRSKLTSGKNNIVVQILKEGEVIDEVNTSFIAPNAL